MARHLFGGLNGRITQNSFWARTRQLEKHETGPHQMTEARPEEKARRNFLAGYEGGALVCAINVDV